MPTRVLLAVFFLAAAPAAGQDGPLQRYVNQPDAAFSWRVVKSRDFGLYSIDVIELTSQTWRKKPEVDRPVWKHWLIVAKPMIVRHKDTAFLYITGGKNGGPVPAAPGPNTVALALKTNSVIAELRMVPNQFIEFGGDGVPRKEDDLIGYTWAKYLETGDARWPAQLPMAKSAVRAMDALQEWSAGEDGIGSKLKNFVVSGGSKRGWTTWLTAAADRRVKAIIPLVIDVLNLEKSFRHHAGAYGFWAYAVGNYVQHRIMQRHNHPRVAGLYKIVDPLSYVDRLKLPKFVINAAGDQFFLPDSSQFYFDKLKGGKLLRYIPNAEHSLGRTDVLKTVITYYTMILKGIKRPEYYWDFRDSGSIRVRPQPPLSPTRAVLWRATNPDARDFRVTTIGRAYTATELQQLKGGEYEGIVKTPKKGFTAFFVELQYDVPGAGPLKVTTGVRVLPEVLPHAGTPLKKVPYERDK